MKKFHASDNAIDIITKYKSCYLTNTIKNGIYYIGYEHKNEEDILFLENVEYARVILRKDLEIYETYLNYAISEGFFIFELNQNQFDALLCLIESSGTDCLYELVNKRNPVEISFEMLDLAISNMCIQDKIRRRYDEYLLFTNRYGTDS